MNDLTIHMGCIELTLESLHGFCDEQMYVPFVFTCTLPTDLEKKIDQVCNDLEHLQFRYSSGTSGPMLGWIKLIGSISSHFRQQTYLTEK